MVASLAEAQTHTITPETFLQHDREISFAKRQMEDASAAVARAKKAAKHSAVNLDAYAFIQKLRKLEQDEQLVVVRQIQQYIVWLEMPIGTQFSMMDAPKMPKAKAKAEHAAFLAGEQGLKAGRDGDSSSANPYKLGTEESSVWIKAFNDGLTERATAAGMEDTDDERPADVAEATKRAGQGRGRKPRAVVSLDNGRAHLNGGATH